MKLTLSITFLFLSSSTTLGFVPTQVYSRPSNLNPFKPYGSTNQRDSSSVIHKDSKMTTRLFNGEEYGDNSVLKEPSERYVTNFTNNTITLAKTVEKALTLYHYYYAILNVAAVMFLF